jgi:subtilisin-like proprotein convertase family protein
VKRGRLLTVCLSALAIGAVLATVASARTGVGTSGADRLTIPDEPNGGGVVSRIEVPRSETGRIVDLDVRVRIRHTSAEDLNIYLVSPSGAFVELSTDNGGDGDDYGGSLGCGGSFTVFDDEAGTRIRDGAAPFLGAFRPQTRLASLDGDPVAGTWRLQVFDDEAGQTGVLGCWEFRARVR